MEEGEKEEKEGGREAERRVKKNGDNKSWKEDKKKETRRGRKEGGALQRKREDKNNIKRTDEMKIVFWNVAGLKKKDREFWKYMEGFDVVGLCKTWIEEKDWKGIEKKLLKAFKWCNQCAVKEKEKGRAKGGILTGVRKSLEEIEATDLNVNGVQERRVRVEGDLWRIVTGYNGVKMKEIKKAIEKKIGELEEGVLCIGGDFNARIGNEGGR